MYEEYHERSKAEYEAAVSEAMRLHELEKEAATAEGRAINPKFHNKVMALKRAREAHKKALEEVIESDDENELEE